MNGKEGREGGQRCTVGGMLEKEKLHGGIVTGKAMGREDKRRKRGRDVRKGGGEKM